MQFKDKLTPQLFWDMNFEKLDVIKNKRLIIERVLSYGNTEQFKALCKAYKKEEIITELKQIGYLDPKTYQFAIWFFSIPEKEMKCYTKKQSHLQHWN